MSDKICNVLFHCAGNSARSMMAEARFRPGQPMDAHRGFLDLAAVAGTKAATRAAFAKVCREIKMRPDIFQSLPLETLEKPALKRELDRIGTTAL